MKPYNRGRGIKYALGEVSVVTNNTTSYSPRSSLLLLLIFRTATIWARQHLPTLKAKQKQSLTIWLPTQTQLPKTKMYPRMHYAGYATKTEQRSGKIISRVSKSSNETVPVEALHDTRIGLALFSMQQIRYPKEEISQSK
jgi:hypothetical protein